MANPHVKILERIYECFLAGNASGVLAECADGITFQISGKSKLAGKYTKHNFASEFMPKLAEISKGSFKLEVHDILASERHAVVLASQYLTSKGEQVQVRTAHVWRFEGGKPVAWYEYPRDLYQYDSLWS